MRRSYIAIHLPTENPQSRVGQQFPSRINALEAEVASLRQIVAEQAIALDDVSSMHRRLLDRAITDSGIRERLETK